jgi:hypothetical protein
VTFASSWIWPTARFRPADGYSFEQLGGRSLLDAEQFRFEQCFDDRGTVHGDGRPLPAPPHFVDLANHQLIASSAFASRAITKRKWKIAGDFSATLPPPKDRVGYNKYPRYAGKFAKAPEPTGSPVTNVA